MNAIRVEGLRKVYGQVRALDGLDFSVQEGSVFGFLGPNGAGKTTTLRILTGLAHPTAGKAWIAGGEVGVAESHSTRRFGYLPEEPAFYPWMTPVEFLDTVGRIFGLRAAERSARTKELLEMSGLSEVRKRRIGGFSRGMRQRLGLAQALVNRPPVLLLDEPASALDPAGRRDVLELIERLRGQATVLMSTHILADVERVCDTIGIIARGKLVIEARREDLLARYASPAFEVEVTNGAVDALPEWVEKVRHAPWLLRASLDGAVARFTVKDVETARRELLTAALYLGLTLNRFEVVRPSLEDVFLRLVEREEGAA